MRLPHAGQSHALRTATLEDADALAGLINAAFRVESFFKIGDRTTPAAIVEMMSAGDFVVLDAEDRQPAACIYVKVDGGRGYFGMLSVSPELQGRGLARALIDAVEDRCRRAGCHTMDIQVVNLRTELPPLYARLGYVETGTLPFPDPTQISQPCHMILMSKPLDAR